MLLNLTDIDRQLNNINLKQNKRISNRKQTQEKLGHPTDNLEEKC